MENFNLEATSIPTNFCQDLNAMDLDFDINGVVNFFKSVITTMGEFLKVNKSKDKPMAVVINNARDELELGAVVKYFPGEDENSKGSWNLTFTFDSNDLADAKIISFNSGNVDIILRSIANMNYSIVFNTETGLRQSVISFVQNIKKWLDANAKENDIVSLELPGFFKASVEVVNGEKVFGFEPAEEISQNVKNDKGEED